MGLFLSGFPGICRASRLRRFADLRCVYSRPPAGRADPHGGDAWVGSGVRVGPAIVQGPAEWEWVLGAGSSAGRS